MSGGDGRHRQSVLATSHGPSVVLEAGHQIVSPGPPFALRFSEERLYPSTIDLMPYLNRWSDFLCLRHAYAVAFERVQINDLGSVGPWAASSTHYHSPEKEALEQSKIMHIVQYHFGTAR